MSRRHKASVLDFRSLFSNSPMSVAEVKERMIYRPPVWVTAAEERFWCCTTRVTLPSDPEDRANCWVWQGKVRSKTHATFHVQGRTKTVWAFAWLTQWCLPDEPDLIPRPDRSRPQRCLPLCVRPIHLALYPKWSGRTIVTSQIKQLIHTLARPRLWHREPASVDAIAERFGISATTVYRVLHDRD